MLKRLVFALCVIPLVGACEGTEQDLPRASAVPVETSIDAEPAAALPVAFEAPRIPLYTAIVSKDAPARLWDYPDADFVVRAGVRSVSVRRAKGLDPQMSRYTEVVSEKMGVGELTIEGEDEARTIEVYSCPGTVDEPRESAMKLHEDFMSCLHGEAESPMVIGHLGVSIAFASKGEPIGYAVSPTSLSDATKACIGVRAQALRRSASKSMCRTLGVMAMF